MNDFSWSCCPICFYRAFFRFLACLLALCSDSSFSRLCLRPVQKLHSDRSGLSQGSSSKAVNGTGSWFFHWKSGLCDSSLLYSHIYLLSPRHTLLFQVFPLLPRHTFYTLLLISTACEALPTHMANSSVFCSHHVLFFSLFLSLLFSLFSSPP